MTIPTLYRPSTGAWTLRIKHGRDAIIGYINYDVGVQQHNDTVAIINNNNNKLENNSVVTHAGHTYEARE